MTITYFTKDNIKYIKHTYDNGTVVSFPDPAFQPTGSPTVLPPLPTLSTDSQKLDFIISRLKLKKGFQP